MAFFGFPSRTSARSASAGGGPVTPVPLHHVAPTPRELRTQAIHRLQVGLFGLAGMLLLVSLANVIMDRAQLGDAGAINGPDASASASPANDPLVDMGVVPGLPVDAAKTPAPANGANP